MFGHFSTKPQGYYLALLSVFYEKFFVSDFDLKQFKGSRVIQNEALSSLNQKNLNESGQKCTFFVDFPPQKIGISPKIIRNGNSPK